MARITAFEQAVADGVAAGIARGNSGNRGSPEPLGNKLFNVDMIMRAMGEVATTMRQVAQVQNNASNASLPGAMRGQFMAESIPLFGNFARAGRDLSESFAMEGGGGRPIVSQSELIRQSEMNFGLGQQTQGARFNFQQQALHLYGEAAGARGRSAALNGISAPSIARFDQSTPAGMIAQQEEMMRAPHRLATSIAEAEATAAQNSHAIATRVRQSAERVAAEDAATADRLSVRYERIARDHGETTVSHGGLVSSTRGGSTRQQIIQAQNDRDLARGRAALSAGAVAPAAMSERQAELAAVQANTAARQQNVETLRTETAIMEQRTQRLAGVARNLGNMQPVDQRIALNSLDRARRHGWNSLTQQERGAIASVDPEWASRFAENSGEQSEVLREWRSRQGAGIAGGTLAENRDATVALAERAQRADLQNRQQQAGGVAATVTAGNDLVISALEQGYLAFVAKINDMFTRMASGLRG